MSEFLANPTNERPPLQQPAPKRTVLARIKSYAREFLALTAWLYLFIKLFVYDVDIYVIQTYFPSFHWLLDFKSLILLCLLAVILLLFEGKNVLASFLFVGFYPLILLAWRFPRFVFRTKSWVAALSIVNGFLAFFRSLKYNVVVSAIFLVSCVGIMATTDKALLLTAAGALLLLLAIGFIHRFIAFFKPNSLFVLYTKLFSSAHTYVTAQCKLDESIRNLPAANWRQDQLDKWANSLQLVVLYNRVCLFAAKKLRDYQKSGLAVVSGVITTLVLFLITAISFGAINVALYKIDPSSFITTGAISKFTFLYYSFNALLFSSTNELVPSAPLTQAASMVEKFFSLVLVAIFLSVLITVSAQRSAKELDKTIEDIETDGRSAEDFIRREYNINTAEDAVSELRRVKAGMLRILEYLTSAI